MKGKVEEETPLDGIKIIENIKADISPAELKLLNSLAEIIVNISIRESHEESNKISSFQRQEPK